MSAPAFTVQGHPVTAEQRDAGLAVMRGVFSLEDVESALLDTGMPFHQSGKYPAAVAARRLIQSERRAGRIRVAEGKGRGMWEKNDG